jgi:hypothetical protein
MDDRMRIALLIDADNASARTLSYVLDEIAELGVANVRRAYGDWSSSGLKSWRKILLDSAIQPMQQFPYTEGKNASDMAMVIDALDLLHTGQLHAFALMSSDSDFTPLAMHLRARGMNVYGFGKANTPISFKSACTKFYHVDAPDEPESTISSGQSQLRGEPASRDSDVASPVATPSAGSPRRKQTMAELQADTQLIDVLRNATVATADDDGWSHLGKMGNQLGFVTPKSYGYKSLKPLIVATGLFQVRADGTHVRLSSAPSTNKKSGAKTKMKK